MKDFKAIPDANTIAEAADLEIFDVNGGKIKFGSIFEKEKTIVIFIRHFFCGACQLFVEHLASVPNESLEKAGTRIVVIGCGEYNPIASYAENAKFTGPIYADPTVKLYHALGMDVENLKTTPADQERPSYLTIGRLTNTLISIWRGPVKNPSLIGKQGNISQLGGDFIFGPGNTCSLASRMQHTEDHMEVTDILKAAGVTLP